MVPMTLEVVAPKVTPGHLGVNAFPWAEVTKIRDVRSGEDVALSAPIVLAGLGRSEAGPIRDHLLQSGAR